jgi:hypothetical protein
MLLPTSKIHLVGTQAFFGPLIIGVGLLMMGLGGALAASQRRLGRLGDTQRWWTTAQCSSRWERDRPPAWP